jgi:hypothetical protein
MKNQNVKFTVTELPTGYFLEVYCPKLAQRINQVLTTYDTDQFEPGEEPIFKSTAHEMMQLTRNIDELAGVLRGSK